MMRPGPRVGRARQKSVGLAALVLSVACTTTVREDQPYTGPPWSTDRPGHPVGGPLAVVSNNASDSLSLLDLGKNEVVATVPIDLDPLAVDGPHHAVVDPKAEYVYTPLAFPAPTLALGPHAAHGASERPGVLVKLRVRDLARVGALTVGNNPGDVAMTPDGALVLVTHFDLRRAVTGMAKGAPLEELRAPLSIVDSASLKLVSASSPCIAAHGMALTKDGKTVYLACYGEDAVARVSLADPGKPVAELTPLGSALVRPPPDFGPYFVTLSADEATLVVSETEGNALRRLDRATMKTTGRVSLDGAVFGPALAGGAWIVPVQQPDKLVRVDPTTFTATSTRVFTGDECVRPHQVAVAGGRTFVVCEGDHVAPGKVLEIDPSTLATLRSFAVGAYPDVIAFPTGTP